MVALTGSYAQIELGKMIESGLLETPWPMLFNVRRPKGRGT